MKPFSLMPRRKPLVLAAAWLCLVLPCLAAQTQTNASAKAPTAATNAAPGLPPVPRSVFIIPTTPQQGKDPFFPRSTRLFTSVVVSTNAQPAAIAAVVLKLNGISGTPDRRMAIINNRTFAPNEEGEVSTGQGHARVRCLEIKEDSVLIQVGGEQRVLRLRSGY